MLSKIHSYRLLFWLFFPLGENEHDSYHDVLKWKENFFIHATKPVIMEIKFSSNCFVLADDDINIPQLQHGIPRLRSNSAIIDMPQ